ncbi:hypothetical protein ABFX02_02G085900 [Erythranthe guttata]
MVVKLPSLTQSRRILNWVSPSAPLSSLSSAITVLPTQEPPDLIQSKTPSEFEAKIRFLKNKLHPDTLVSILKNTHDLNSSVNLFKWASLQKQFHHTADTYRMMILKLGNAGNIEEMEGFCNEMVREKFSGFDKSLSELIDSFVRSRRLSEASRVLYVMNSSNSKPSICVFNALMRALVQDKRDFKDVLFVYKEMVKSRILPNIDTLNHLLESLFESGRVDAAMDQYRRIEKKGCNPNIRTFQILISGLAVRNRVEESILVLNDMFQCGCEPDSGFYTFVIPLFCNMQNLEIGLRLFEMMRASNIAPDCVTYGAVIRCLCGYLRLDDAVKLYEEMIDSGLSPDNRVFVDMVNGFCKLNRLDEARHFLDEGNIEDICVCNTLLESYCENGNFVMAKGMFDKMFERSVIDATSWNILIRFLCEKGVVGKALEYLCRMVVSSFPADSATYSAIILGNCKSGNVVHALDLFARIKTKSWVLDSVSYAEFVESLCERGNIQEAADVFSYMSDKGCALQSTSFGVLIEKICLSGEVKRAIELLSLAHYTGLASYNSILRGLFESGHKNCILVVLSRMIVLGCNFTVETYCILIQGMSALNRKGDCLAFFDLMLSEELVPDSQTLACLLSCLAKDSELHLILPSMYKLISKSEFLDSSTYNILVDFLWREGYKNEAKYLLDLMLEKGWVPHGSTHALLMGSIARNEMVSREFADGKFGNQEDSVSCILEEGLGKT